MITVSLVDDNAELGRSLAASLSNSSRVRCHGCYTDAQEAFEQMLRAPPDVVLIDLNLPGMREMEYIAKLKAKLPRLHVLVLTRIEQTEQVFKFIRAGASGYLLKNTPSIMLIEAIEQIHAGGASMTMQVARNTLAYMQQAEMLKMRGQGLNPGEKEILALLAKGDSCEEIAETVAISADEVRA